MENGLEIFHIGSPAAGAGIALGEVLEYHKEQPVLLMLSGGSAFSILDYIEADVLGPNLTISILDERCSSDSKINNFLQLKEKTFFKNAVDREVKIISTAVENEKDCSVLAKNWEKALLGWKENNPEGIVIATMGIGVDGHVAGIMPNVDLEVFDGKDLVVSYSVPSEVNKYTDRITVTYTFLKEFIDGAIVCVIGEEKKEIIKLLEKEVKEGSGELPKSLKEMPAMIFKQMKLVTLYTGL